MISGFLLFVITVQTLQSAHRATARTSNVKQTPILYPGPIQDVSNRYGGGGGGGTQDTKVVPESCRGKTFCTIRPADYPQNQFDEIFKGRKQIPQASAVPDDLFDNRQGDPSETDGCDTVVSYEPLYQVRQGREGAWRTVIQSPKEDFVQRVRLEECKDPRAACFTAVADMGIETFCVQKYTVWEVLVSDGKNGSERIKTELPVCCSCRYRL